MRAARLARNLADSNRGCTICFPVNIRNEHWYGVVASSDTNFLRVWETVGLDDGARELRIDFLVSVVEPFLRFIAEDFWNTQVGPSATTKTECSIQRVLHIIFYHSVRLYQHFYMSLVQC